MATAKAETRTKEVVTTVDETVVVLELSKAEAELLRALCDRVGGLPRTTYRGMTDGIGLALARAGLGYETGDKYFAYGEGITAKVRN